MENEIDANSEEIEGLSDDEDSSWGDYPIDTLLIRNENRTVYDVLRRIKKGAFVMDPDFQRDFIWPDDKQSKLIESVLMRIPLPVFYLAEDEQGRMIVVDGLQRLSTFKRFLSNELQLKLPDQKDLDGKCFQDLSPKLQNRIEDSNLILYIIDVKVPEQARLDIFERVNSGLPLTRQQMRNCLYMGLATRFLKDEASTELFIEATGHSLKPATMRDREFVNRFCAFHLIPLAEYRGDMDDFLARVLKDMNIFEKAELEKLSDQFRLGLRNNHKVYGKNWSATSAATPRARRILNASLWDVMSIGLSRYPEHLVDKCEESLKIGFWKLMDDEEFFHLITYGPNAVKNVKYRFNAVNKMLKEVFND